MLVPAPFAFGFGPDILDDERGEGKEVRDPVAEAQFPLPTGFRGRRQTATCPVEPGWTAGGLAGAPAPAHVSPGFDRLLHPGDRIRLDVQIGVGDGFDHQPFLLAARINAHRDRLGGVTRGFSGSIGRRRQPLSRTRWLCRS